MRTRKGQIHSPVAGMQEIREEMSHRAQYEGTKVQAPADETKNSDEVTSVPVVVRTISLHSYLVSRGVTNEVELDMMRAHAKGVVRATAAGWAQIYADYK
jgi:hypothetical protein